MADTTAHVPAPAIPDAPASTQYNYGQTIGEQTAPVDDAGSPQALQSAPSESGAAVPAIIPPRLLTPIAEVPAATTVSDDDVETATVVPVSGGDDGHRATPMDNSTGSAGDEIPDAAEANREKQETPTEIADRNNRKALDGDIATNQAVLDENQPEFDELARKAYRGDHSTETYNRMRELAGVMKPARDKLDQLTKVHEALGASPDTYLMQYEPDGHRMVHAAISVGNPDAASNVSTTVPGVSTTAASLPGMVREAANLRKVSDELLYKAGKPAGTATIAWLGYDPPPNALDTHSPKDTWNTLTKDRANEGAPRLADFLQGIRKTNPNADVSLLGHSYGSLTASLALQELKKRKGDSAQVVDSAVFYGTPGLGIDRVGELGLPPNSAYIMRASGDLVANGVAPLAKYHGWGSDPHTIEGIQELSAAAGTDPLGGTHPGASGHSQYPQTVKTPSGKEELTTAGYNLAAVVAGLPGWAVWSD